MAAFDPAAVLPCSSRGWVSVIVAPDEPHASRADPRRGGKPAVVAGAESPPRASGEGITGTDGSAAVLLGVLRSPWPRLAVFVVLGVGAGWLTLTQGAAVVVETRGWVAGLGAAGVVAFVVIYAGATVALLPVSLLSAAAGVLFGPLVGVGAVWAGAMLGAAASFGLGRVFSRAAVEALAGPRIEALDRFLVRNGLWAVLLVRLIPLFPFTLVNYGSAATAIRPRHYLAGTAAGIVPGVVSTSRWAAPWTTPPRRSSSPPPRASWSSHSGGCWSPAAGDTATPPTIPRTIPRTTTPRPTTCPTRPPRRRASDQPRPFAHHRPMGWRARGPAADGFIVPDRRAGHRREGTDRRAARATRVSRAGRGRVMASASSPSAVFHGPSAQLG